MFKVFTPDNYWKVHMIRQIAPKEFFDAFTKCAAQRANEMAALWDEKKGYTHHIRQELLPAVAALLGLQVYSKGDYYWLDAVYFESQDTEHFRQGLTYAKCLSIALEHENDAPGTCVEMNKLQLFNTPLKVLVTYDGGMDGGEQLGRLLKAYSEIVCAADIFGDFATLRRTLVIIGSLQAGTPHWRGFEFNGTQFADMAR